MAARRTALASSRLFVPLAVAMLVLLPIATVLYLAASPSEGIWRHLLSTVLPRYVQNTLILMIGVAFFSTVIGTSTAWLIAMYRFPLRKFLEWALFLPLAIPAYVGAYALVDFLEYAGPIQTGLRSIFGWNLADEYFFPEIRSRGGAVFALTAALYPYVYLIARAALKEQSGAMFEVSRALGKGPYARFFLVGWPLIRPAAVAASAIVMMETVSDFGVVEYFAVQTLTTGIFSEWLDAYNIGGAAQLATLVLLIMFVLVALEKFSRRKIEVFNSVRCTIPIRPVELKGRSAWIACTFCIFPFAAGFCLPGGVMLWHALRKPEHWFDPGLVRALANTIFTGSIAAAATVTAATVMVYGIRIANYRPIAGIMPATMLGYAVPGVVLAMGVMIPVAAFDHFVADAILEAFGFDPGLLITGSGLAIIIAYFVRFFAIAQNSVDAAMGRVGPSLPAAARSLGRSATGTLRAIYVPMMKGSLFTALALVFVDCVKELPATLLLRPFNFDTLATRVYEQASLENIGEAAPPAILVALVGCLGVALIIRIDRQKGSISKSQSSQDPEKRYEATI
ncbi:MAG: iron ABC transporter permease [Albidovulum sp.]|nr:iron ABC transporter permease [Albidovulum sp.]